MCFKCVQCVFDLLFYMRLLKRECVICLCFTLGCCMVCVCVLFVFVNVSCLNVFVWLVCDFLCGVVWSVVCIVACVCKC